MKRARKRVDHPCPEAVVSGRVRDRHLRAAVSAHRDLAAVSARRDLAAPPRPGRSIEANRPSMRTLETSTAVSLAPTRSLSRIETRRRFDRKAAKRLLKRG